MTKPRARTLIARLRPIERVSVVEAIKTAYRFASRKDRHELKQWMHRVLSGIERTTASPTNQPETEG